MAVLPFHDSTRLRLRGIVQRIVRRTMRESAKVEGTSSQTTRGVRSELAQLHAGRIRTERATRQPGLTALASITAVGWAKPESPLAGPGDTDDYPDRWIVWSHD